MPSTSLAASRLDQHQSDQNCAHVPRACLQVRNWRSDIMNYTLDLVYPAADPDGARTVPLTELVCVLAADQTCSSAFFATLLRHIDAGDDVAVALCPRISYNVDGDCDIFDQQRVAYYERTQLGMDAYGVTACLHANMLVRARALQEAGGLPAQTSAESWELGMLLVRPLRLVLTSQSMSLLLGCLALRVFMAPLQPACTLLLPCPVCSAAQAAQLQYMHHATLRAHTRPRTAAERRLEEPLRARVQYDRTQPRGGVHCGRRALRHEPRPLPDLLVRPLPPATQRPWPLLPRPLCQPRLPARRLRCGGACLLCARLEHSCMRW